MNQIDMQETIDMLGRHLLNFARLSSVWHEFSSRNPDENWRRREKSKGLGGQNTHKKLSPEQLSLYLAYNMPPRLLFLTPPSATLSWHYVHRSGGAQCAKTTTTASKEDNDQMEEDRSLFFPSNQPFLRSFSLQQTSGNFTFFFKKIKSDNICF